MSLTDAIDTCGQTDVRSVTLAYTTRCSISVSYPHIDVIFEQPYLSQ